MHMYVWACVCVCVCESECRWGGGGGSSLQKRDIIAVNSLMRVVLAEGHTDSVYKTISCASPVHSRCSVLCMIILSCVLPSHD